ncbi:diaminopimelate epimerase [Lysobacter arseniciresistens ZS79]|uniref:Diaminopimelate epimerase n=1 Tax=Lysobacter arseniciresistens ZS79 TaxID=913325 RepID=A0A0A0EZT7_9GAMM|nr:diaminopimelate epimerase [Lysobacter arseniciresistens]KGM56426.1 diaminopimelate epimerase [Lysobacter arseniciresistens ZS79]
MAETGPGLRFSKMHGAGNDFVVLDLRGNAPPPSPALCRALADRHTGVGCDQILTVGDPRAAGSVASYGIWNADGSPSGQCGNGARCIAAWLVRDGAATTPSFVIDSPAGTHAVERDGDGYRVAMGVPEFEPARIPLHGFDDARDTYVVAAAGAIVGFGAVSMGNPHAVIEVDDVATAAVEHQGRLLQRSDNFPESVNVGFAQVESRGRIRLRVYERGVGETRACGSGACAAAVVLMRRGRVDREVTVALPGGELRIAWPGDDAPVTMAGPASFVFEGEWVA